MKITNISTESRLAARPSPGRISLTGTFPTSRPEPLACILVRLETEGLAGLGYTWAPAADAERVRAMIADVALPLLRGEDARDTDRLFAKMSRASAIGFAGALARGYCGIDLACWDLKAKAVGVPLFQLLGNHRPSASFFVSDLAEPGWEVSEVLKLAKPLMKQGASGLRVVVGSGEVHADADRVREIQEGLGDQGWVCVAAGERYDLGTAQALSHFFEDIGVDLFEDPLPTADESGYARMANLKALPLAVGSSFDRLDDFYRVLRAGVVRTIRPDAARLGGLTPLLKVATVAEAYHVAVSPVRMPELGIHLACGLASIANVDHVRWFHEILGSPRIEGGKMIPPANPGLFASDL